MSPRTPWRTVRRWLRQGWVWGAAVAVGLQVFGFWLASPVVGERWRQRTTPAPAASRSGAPAEDWSRLLWALTPSIPMATGVDDFSDEAWMKRDPGGVAIEAFAVPWHGLPFPEAFGSPVAFRDPVPRDHEVSDPTFAGGSDSGRGALGALPAPPLLTFDPATTVRVASGARGWKLVSRRISEVGPVDPATTPPVVVRLVLDHHGEPAAPALLWEGSGHAPVDAAALEASRTLKWVRDPDTGSGQPHEPLVWAWVIFEWGVGPRT